MYTRPVITRAQAERLIAAIPWIEEEDHFTSHSLRMSTEHYQTVLRSHDCRELVQLIKAVYAKSRRGGRRVSQIDQRYRKRAEELLHGELAVALGIPIDEVQPYISRSISEAAAETPKA